VRERSLCFLIYCVRERGRGVVSPNRPQGMTLAGPCKELACQTEYIQISMQCQEAEYQYFNSCQKEELKKTLEPSMQSRKAIDRNREGRRQLLNYKIKGSEGWFSSFRWLLVLLPQKQAVLLWNVPCGNATKPIQS